MMRTIRLLLLLLILLFAGRSAQAQSPTPTAQASLHVLAPQGGEAIRGVVDILIEVPVGSPMAFGGLYFGYAQDAGGTRFPIWEADSPRGGDPLTRWDTTSLTDGEYSLYLYIRLENGNTLQATIPNLRVRNYTPIETATPTPTPAENAQRLTPTPTATATSPPPTPTPLPPNPAALSPATLQHSLQRGALGSLVLFVLLVLYRLLRGRRF